jgi:hypothetical protein
MCYKENDGKIWIARMWHLHHDNTSIPAHSIVDSSALGKAFDFCLSRTSLFPYSSPPDVFLFPNPERKKISNGGGHHYEFDR